MHLNETAPLSSPQPAILGMHNQPTQPHLCPHFYKQQLRVSQKGWLRVLAVRGGGPAIARPRPRWRSQQRGGGKERSARGLRFAVWETHKSSTGGGLVAPRWVCASASRPAATQIKGTQEETDSVTFELSLVVHVVHITRLSGKLVYADEPGTQPLRKGGGGGGARKDAWADCAHR